LFLQLNDPHVYAKPWIRFDLKKKSYCDYKKKKTLFIVHCSSSKTRQSGKRRSQPTPPHQSIGTRRFTAVNNPQPQHVTHTSSSRSSSTAAHQPVSSSSRHLQIRHPATTPRHKKPTEPHRGAVSIVP
jgi:hypothetical protein